MIITRRQPGDRRWGFPAEFPLVDSEGFLVPVDRRQFPNRRKADTIADGCSPVTAISKRH
jgi:hypothetical protein